MVLLGRRGGEWDGPPPPDKGGGPGPGRAGGAARVCRHGRRQPERHPVPLRLMGIRRRGVGGGPRDRSPIRAIGRVRRHRKRLRRQRRDPSPVCHLHRDPTAKGLRGDSRRILRGGEVVLVFRIRLRHVFRRGRFPVGLWLRLLALGHARAPKGRAPGGGGGATSFTANVILDADGDQLRDSIERNGGTDPAEWDSDGDGIPDNYELSSLDVEECARRYGVENCRTDPRVFETDNDGLSDWEGLWPGEGGYLTLPTN